MAPRGPAPARPVPTRTCVACRTARPKRDLDRVVRTPAGTVELDPSGRANGRGAYLCRDAVCWTAAATKPILERALEARLDPDLRARLAAGPASPSIMTEHTTEPTAAARAAAAITITEGGARGKE